MERHLYRKVVNDTSPKYREVLKWRGLKLHEPL